MWSRMHVEWNIAENITFRSDSYLLDAEREWQNLEEYSYNTTTNMVDRDFYLGIVHEEEQFGTRFDFLVESDLRGMENRLSFGAEINDIELNYLNNFSTGGFDVGDSVPVFGFNPGTTPQATIPTILDYQTDTKQFAVFIDDVIQLNEQFSVVLGGRYDDIDFSRFDLAIGGNTASRFATDFSEFTWRTGLVFQPTEDISIYAQASTAADPVTSPISISASNKDFDLATGRQY